MRRVLITGCSGGGKSTLLAEMAGRGWATVPEPGRRVIAAERAAGGQGMPWRDFDRFLKLCCTFAISDWETAGAGTTLFDRGLVDAVLAQRQRTPGLDAKAILSAFPYDRHVAVVPPWPALFHHDTDRRLNFQAAIAEYDTIRAGLSALGYILHDLPRGTVAARADWLETLLRSG